MWLQSSEALQMRSAAKRRSTRAALLSLSLFKDLKPLRETRLFLQTDASVECVQHGVLMELSLDARRRRACRSVEYLR